METRQTNCGVNDSFDHIGNLKFKRADAAVCSGRRLTMNTARKNCIWYDQCGSECQGKCDDYSPADDAGENEVFYQSVLKENAQEYEKLIQEYSDRG